jgi:CP family cyanate transporter-like MFS transporter
MSVSPHTAGVTRTVINPLTALLLLWLAGVALRLTILAVPPVIPLIHDDLHMSETQVGVLSGIPMVLFAGAAIAGSLMVARLGAVNALLTGLALCAVGSVVRGVGPHLAMLYFGTVVTAFGVAVMQPALPLLVRTWVPRRIGFATAVYTNGLIVGEIFPAALTIPLVLPMLHRSWQWSFVFWAFWVAVIAAVIFAMAPKPQAQASSATAASQGWMPDFTNPLIWRIGLLLGSVNATYFSLNGFLPDYLTQTGQADLINAALTANNACQLPASFMLLMSAERLVRTYWSYIVCALMCAAGLLMITLLHGGWVIAGAAVLGCFAAAVLVLILALPPLISPPDEVHRVSAGMFTISYSLAVIVPIVSGVLWDLTGWLLAPFIPMGLCMAAVIGLAPSIVLREKSAGA